MIADCKGGLITGTIFGRQLGGGYNGLRMGFLIGLIRCVCGRASIMQAC
jgi:hypothetical protein